MTFDLVEVRWVDSHTDNDWKTLTEARAVAGEEVAVVVRTVGYLVLDEPGYVLVASSYSPPTSDADLLVNCTTQIPRSALLGVTVLEAQAIAPADE